MLTISRENALQIFYDYLDYRYPPIDIEGLSLTASQFITRTQTQRSIDSLLDRWMYKEECGGRMMSSPDGLSIGITGAGKEVYSKVSNYFRKEYSNV